MTDVFDWATVLAVINAIIALGIFAVNLILVRRLKIARVLRYFIMAVALYWAALYSFVAIVPEGFIDPFLFGQVFVRPAFTFTLGIMLFCGVYRLKSIK